MATIHPPRSQQKPDDKVLTATELQQSITEKAQELVDFAIREARRHGADYPRLESGFTLKMHFGAFETIPHAKLHVLAVE